MIDYRSDFKIKTLLTALRDNMEANGRMINMIWQELDKPVKQEPVKTRDPNFTVSGGDRKIVRVLANRNWPISVNTIARETGLKHKSIAHMIWRLRHNGYNIETSYDRSRKAKYRLIASA